MKIGYKFVITLVALSLLVLGSVGGTLLIQARNHLTTLAHEKAVATAKEYSELLGSYFTSYWYAAQTVARILDGYSGADDDSSLFPAEALLDGLIENYPGILGAWVTINGAEPIRRGSFALPGNDMLSSYMANPNVAGTVYNPRVVRMDGREYLAATIVATMFDSGRATGAIGIDFDTDIIQQIVGGLYPLGDGITKVFSNNGTIVGHHLYPQNRGRSILETERDMGGPYMSQLENAVNRGEELQYSNFHPGFQEQLLVFIHPIQIGEAETRWSLAILFPERTVLAPVRSMEITALIIALIVTALIIPAIFLVTQRLMRPVVRITGALKDISEGEGDLTKTLPVNTKDEMGELSRYFNMTLKKIKDLVVAIKADASRLSDIGVDLANNMTEAATSMNEITATIGNIKSLIVTQSTGVSETNATMGEVASNIDRLSGHIESQGSHILQTSSAIEQMVLSINNVTETLARNSGSVMTLKEASEVGRSSLHGVSVDIQEIARESEGLLEINRVMQNIASQTNLLSMNAAIEAAHAGESGRGFGVVADEIRKLAENSSEQSKTIGVVLKKIKDSIDKITRSTESVLAKFEAIDASVGIVAEQGTSIRDAMEEQQEGSRQVLSGIMQVNDMTGRVKTGSGEMLVGAKEVILEGSRLEKSTQEITSGISEIVAGAQKINVAVDHVNRISMQNRESIEHLVREVSRFKVE
ncbi:MAG: methyl-accepting chemotaxis protein [Treponema sp.]|nr:methyl-accepting chemotaxis protein [Treponema sp.]